MTDIFTVIFTGQANGVAESIPWTLSFADLELAKNHVREEAQVRVADEDAEPDKEWVDYEDHSTYIQSYDSDTCDTWTIVRTELVEENPSPETSTL